MLVILSAAIAPGLALLSYFYLKDQYDTEPIAVVIKTFLFGVLLVLPIMFLQYVLEKEQILNTDFANAFLWAAMIEEFFKWFILIYAIYQHVAFDEPYDGIVYGAAVSLGFASMENVFYLLANGVEHAFSRAVLPVSSHALFGVIMGYYLGKAKFSLSNNRTYLILGLLAPIVLHGVYDYILLSQERWVYFIMPFMVGLWWLGMKKVKQARLLSKFHAEKLSQNQLKV